ncbi:hypothetical protein OSB04_031871 [Centaurea solstitialis]|uniref:Gag-pol polyprotein n=1 Tax=Centaurea solstitialis TaxID=347529 RepID=A0AA38SVH3_9ASTR|nr:hypothetical protein OSB04_031871 [Centaurea solstitialis]
MATAANSSFMSTGSQSKPLTLSRDEYKKWKVQMVSFLEGIHPKIIEYLHNPPHIPMKLIPRVPATATTPEIPESSEPEPVVDWSDTNREIADLDSCETSMELWVELQKQLEGGLKTLKNNRTICINEYHDFKALEGESLKDTYSRFNTLISKCKRFGVRRTSEGNNALFLKSLGGEWMNLTMSIQSTLDLEIWSLSDLYGTLVSQEPHGLKMKKHIGGPLALMGKAAEGNHSEKKRKESKLKIEDKKKNKLLYVESDVES